MSRSPIEVVRATYFERCWPNSKNITGFERIHEVADGDRVFVVYEGEVHRVRDGKLTETEVYFGWDVPHKAPEGGFINPS